MHPLADVHALLSAWARATEARDVEQAADLYVRDGPVVTFSDGARAADWLDVRVRLARDFERAAIERVEVHHPAILEVGEDTLVVSFVYDLHVRDLWGTPSLATRHATLTLVRTKDGPRIAAAHYAQAR